MLSETCDFAAWFPGLLFGFLSFFRFEHRVDEFGNDASKTGRDRVKFIGGFFYPWIGIGIGMFSNGNKKHLFRIYSQGSSNSVKRVISDAALSLDQSGYL